MGSLKDARLSWYTCTHVLRAIICYEALVLRTFALDHPKLGHQSKEWRDALRDGPLGIHIGTLRSLESWKSSCRMCFRQLFKLEHFTNSINEAWQWLDIAWHSYTGSNFEFRQCCNLQIPSWKIVNDIYPPNINSFGNSKVVNPNLKNPCPCLMQSAQLLR